MIICAAQTRPVKGNVQQNIEQHILFVQLAYQQGASLVFFPEFSLTGYEPELALSLAMEVDDPRLDAFQHLSDRFEMVICVGAPLSALPKPKIGQIIFSPKKIRQHYAKQTLHNDELPFFSEGEASLIMHWANHRIALGICYETLLPEHAARAAEAGATLYLASVAKSGKGLTKAFAHYPEVARRYGMNLVMCNSTGFCDNFFAAGQSSAWGPDGVCSGQLEEGQPGLLVFATETRRCASISI